MNLTTLTGAGAVQGYCTAEDSATPPNKMQQVTALPLAGPLVVGFALDCPVSCDASVVANSLSTSMAVPGEVAYFLVDSASAAGITLTANELFIEALTPNTLAPFVLPGCTTTSPCYGIIELPVAGVSASVQVTIDPGTTYTVIAAARPASTGCCSPVTQVVHQYNVACGGLQCSPCPAHLVERVHPRIRFANNLGLPLGEPVLVRDCVRGHYFRQRFGLLGRTPVGSSGTVDASAGGTALYTSPRAPRAPASQEFTTLRSVPVQLSAVLQRRDWYLEDADEAILGGQNVGITSAFRCVCCQWPMQMHLLYAVGIVCLGHSTCNFSHCVAYCRYALRDEYGQSRVDVAGITLLSVLARSGLPNTYLSACDMSAVDSDTGLGTCAVLLPASVFGSPGAAAAAGTLHLLVRS